MQLHLVIEEEEGGDLMGTMLSAAAVLGFGELQSFSLLIDVKISIYMERQKVATTRALPFSFFSSW